MSKKVIHSSEPNVNRRAPDKYRSNWYNRVNRRSQGNKDNGSLYSEQDRERNQERPLLTSATSSNSTGAVVKFGF